MRGYIFQDEVWPRAGSSIGRSLTISAHVLVNILLDRILLQNYEAVPIEVVDHRSAYRPPFTSFTRAVTSRQESAGSYIDLRQTGLLVPIAQVAHGDFICGTCLQRVVVVAQRVG